MEHLKRGVNNKECWPQWCNIWKFFCDITRMAELPGDVKSRLISCPLGRDWWLTAVHADGRKQVIQLQKSLIQQLHNIGFACQWQVTIPDLLQLVHCLIPQTGYGCWLHWTGRWCWHQDARCFCCRSAMVNDSVTYRPHIQKEWSRTISIFRFHLLALWTPLWGMQYSSTIATITILACRAHAAQLTNY